MDKGVQQMDVDAQPTATHPFLDNDRLLALKQELETIRKGTHPKIVQRRAREEELHQLRVAEIEDNLAWDRAAADRMRARSYDRVVQKTEDELTAMKQQLIKRLMSFRSRIQKMERNGSTLNNVDLRRDLREILDESLSTQSADETNVSKRRTRTQKNKLTKYRFGLSESDIKKDIGEMARNLYPERIIPHVQTSGIGFLNNPVPMKQRPRRKRNRRRTNYADIDDDAFSAPPRPKRRRRVVEVEESDSGMSQSPIEEAVRVEVNDKRQFVRIEDEVFHVGDRIRVESVADVHDPWNGAIMQVNASQINLRQLNPERTNRRLWVKNLRQGKFRVLRY